MNRAFLPEGIASPLAGRSKGWSVGCQGRLGEGHWGEESQSDVSRLVFIYHVKKFQFYP